MQILKGNYSCKTVDIVPRYGHTVGCVSPKNKRMTTSETNSDVYL